MQPTYFRQKHLLQPVLCTCSSLTTGKSISCRQFHKHKQYSTSSTKTQIHAVHLIRRQKAFHAGSFNTHIYIYTCTKLIKAISRYRQRQTDIYVERERERGLSAFQGVGFVTWTALLCVLSANLNTGETQGSARGI